MWVDNTLLLAESVKRVCANFAPTHPFICYKMTWNMDERWLSIQSNNSFIRYIFSSEEKSLYARLHRITLIAIVMEWGINYYDLSRISVNNAYMAALSDVVDDCKSGKVDLLAINLHEYFFIQCRKRMFRMKKKQLKFEKEKDSALG